MNQPYNDFLRLIPDESKGFVDDLDAFLREKKKEIAGDPLAMLVKCFEAVNDLTTMAMHFPREKMVSYILEAETHIVPLLRAFLGISPGWNNASWLPGTSCTVCRKPASDCCSAGKNRG